jgi:hypothetical protein
MVVQYPHYLYVRDASDVSQDGWGDWVSSARIDGYIAESYCRVELSGGQPVSLQDGRTFIPSATIYLPLSAPEITGGQRIYAVDAYGRTLIDNVVAGGSRGQYNCRIWV